MINLARAQHQINGIYNHFFLTSKNPQYLILKKSSKTYYYSTLLFPPKVRDQILVLYGFVRTADDLVDTLPQQIKDFNIFRTQLKKALNAEKTNNRIIDDFIILINQKEINPKWITAFINSMKLDTKKNNYKTFKELDLYLHGSSEVIGLMISKILGLEKAAHPYAKKLGRAMQYINFIRDINEDLSLNRTYIPKSELTKYNLKDLQKETAENNPEQFIKLIRAQIELYFKWQNQAEVGYKYIPQKYLLAIKTASDLYKWTAIQIYNDPFIIYKHKVKPNLSTIITLASQNVFKLFL